MQIGPYKLNSRFVLAPMVGVTDAPFRRICRQYGAGLTTSEMTTADISLWQRPTSQRRLDLDLDAEPIAVQIAGSEPEQMALAAQACVERGAQIVDINMGCPAKKVCKRLAGSALLTDEALVARILDAVVGAVEVPVTLKMRTGWNPENRNGPRVARIAEDCGIQSLAIHGRTRECKYKGEAEYETIARIKQSVSIPVLANGDITTLEKSLEVLRLTNADGLMIGRGAQGRPWFFRELAEFHSGQEKITPLAKNELRDIMLGHLRELHRFYGDSVGVRVARKHITWYSQHLVNAGEYRHQAVRTESAKQQIELTEKYFACGEGGVSRAA